MGCAAIPQSLGVCRSAVVVDVLCCGLPCWQCWHASVKVGVCARGGCGAWQPGGSWQGVRSGVVFVRLVCIFVSISPMQPWLLEFVVDLPEM